MNQKIKDFARLGELLQTIAMGKASKEECSEAMKIEAEYKLPGQAKQYYHNAEMINEAEKKIEGLKELRKKIAVRLKP